MPSDFRVSRRALLSGAIVAPFLPARDHAFAQDATPVASPVAADPNSATRQIQALLAESDAIFGIMILDPFGDVVVRHNAETPFVSASLYKLVLIAEVLLKVEQAELVLRDNVEILDEHFIAANGEDSYFSPLAIGTTITVEELLYSAASYSSNTGAQALMSLTSPQELDQLAVQLGMTSTFYRLTPDEVTDLFALDDAADRPLDYARSVRFIASFAEGGTANVTTPRDVARFFELLRDDALGSAATSWRLKHLLTPRIISDRLPALLPPDTIVVHKTGNLTGVLHDAGILETPDGAVVVVAMAQAATDLDQTMAIEQQIGLLAYAVGST